VGDMTIKQFFQVAGGALFALFIYSSGLPTYFKVPLIIVSLLLGLALAFFPLQDRPLSQWILLFLKAIYSPNLFIWGKVTPHPSYFQTDTPLAPKQSSQPSQSPILKGPEPPHPDVKIPQVKSPQVLIHKDAIVPPLAAAQIQEKTEVSAPKKEEKIIFDQPAESARLEKVEAEFLSKVANEFTAVAQDFKAPVVHISPEVTQQRVASVRIPQKEETKVEVSERPTLVSPIEFKANPQVETSVGHEITPIPAQKLQSTTPASFSNQATPPAPPISTNIVVGQVVDSKNSIVEGAIIEIKDADGRPVRALKTNKLGHFMIATPLTNGKYTLIAEKEGLFFDGVEVEAKGNIISPIAIRSK